MILELDMTSVEPIYQQIRNQIVLGLAHQHLHVNDSLPSVRQLADDIGVNMMTVSKAYNLLKEEGYVEMDRRKGTKIVSQFERQRDFETQLTKELTLLLAEATVKGMTQEETQKMCHDIYRDFERKEK